MHRDVKPSNILVGDDDFAYLIDFGIARATGQSSLTGTGNVIGTWAYLAPERFSSDRTDPRADIYALTCVLHECLTGRPPFPGDSVERQIAGHLSQPPPRPSALNDTVPTSIDSVVARGMAKDPDQRYRSAKDMASAARAAVSRPILPPRPGPGTGPVQPSGYQSGPIRPPAQFVPPAANYPHGPANTPATPWNSVPRQPGYATGPPLRGGSGRKLAWIAGAAVSLILVLGVVAAFVLTRSSVSPEPTDSDTTTAAAGDVIRSPRLGLEVWQDGAAVPLVLEDAADDAPLTVAALRQDPFELRFPTLAEGQALQICAWTDQSVFDIDQGSAVGEHPCFRPGTGVADYEFGSGTIYISGKTGHNYLIADRVATASDTQDKYYVSQVFEDGADTPITQYTGALYLTCFIDKDGNELFDVGEYDYLELDFGS